VEDGEFTSWELQIFAQSDRWEFVLSSLHCMYSTSDIASEGEMKAGGRETSHSLLS
jgi:hypothetical protein